MIKNISLLVCLIICSALFSQKMITRSGEIKFEASMPAFEEIASKNNTASCLFDAATGEIVVLVLVKGFRFKIPLMEEHFNENYMESSKFPKATFKGKILNFDASKLAATKTTYELEGELSMHGVKKKIKTKISLAQNTGKINAVSIMVVKPQDYAIEIPSLVKGKIADTVKISINFILEAK